MSNIPAVIPPASFELIRDRILQILLIEFENQYLLTYDDALYLGVYIERSTPLDKTELNAIVISLFDGDYSNKNQGYVDGIYTFNIDCFSSAKSSQGISGDTLAMKDLQKIMRVVRAVLENPVYKTLNFTPGGINKTYISKISIGPSNKEDALNTSWGRLIFNVIAPETTSLITPALIGGYDTRIKIDNSGRGYFYEGNNY